MSMRGAPCAGSGATLDARASRPQPPGARAADAHAQNRRASRRYTLAGRPVSDTAFATYTPKLAEVEPAAHVGVPAAQRRHASPSRSTVRFGCVAHQPAAAAVRRRAPRRRRCAVARRIHRRSPKPSSSPNGLMRKSPFHSACSSMHAFALRRPSERGVRRVVAGRAGARRRSLPVIRRKSNPGSASRLLTAKSTLHRQRIAAGPAAGDGAQVELRPGAEAIVAPQVEEDARVGHVAGRLRAHARRGGRDRVHRARRHARTRPTAAIRSAGRRRDCACPASRSA